ncbi:MAG: MBL fold metallo-hydrolase [Candidatus Micrarchaeota archaeon]
MKNIFLFAIVAMLLVAFGCINLGGEQKPVPDGKTGDGNGTSVKTPKVIETGGQNFTVAANKTPDENEGKTPGIKYESTPDDMIAIYFVYVGELDKHGDAILIKKGDVEILVDGGPSKTGEKTIDFLKTRGVDDIELMISTHADPEHYNGLIATADEYPVEEFWWAGNTFDDGVYSSFIADMKKKTTVKAAAYGDKIEINGIKIEILNPQKDLADRYNDVKNDAIALKVSDRKFCAILTSDIVVGAQTNIIQQTGVDIKCPVMQAPYHGLGQGSAQIDLFLLKVNPKDVISSGGPAGYAYTDVSKDKIDTRKALRDKLKTRKMNYWENYKNGTVRVVSDGTEYNVQYMK